MKKTGLMKAMSLTKNFYKQTPEDIRTLQRKRLNDLVSYAKKHSPYMYSLYNNVPDDCSLENLPITTKKELMEHFDEWVTDSSVHLKDLYHFMENMDNVGRKYDGKYIIFTTSGSTGNPLVSLCDKGTNNMMTAINLFRTYARKEDMKSFIKHGGRTMGVFATNGFYLSNSSVRARLLSMPWKKKQIGVTSALLPVENLVKDLNAFQPVMLGGYPSNLELLADEQDKGTLNIHPVIIMTGGEYLSESVRHKLETSFGCFVQTSYSCTEGGTIACECINRHFHINDDWVIIEPVDQNNQPVPDGTRADKILLTNLFNYSQPYIRYEVTDRVVMHHETCGCGKTSPWLTLEGRTDDMLTFEENNQVVKVAPLAVYAALKEVHDFRRFQLIVTPGNNIELRFEAMENADRQCAFAKGKEVLLNLLAKNHITHITITSSEELPKQQPGSGKYKHIINMNK